jgi:hypothetical protein
MSFESINTLEIPQEATELTLNELKLICGGWKEEKEEKEHCRLVRKEVTVKKIFKCKEREEHEKHEHCEDDN